MFLSQLSFYFDYLRAKLLIHLDTSIGVHSADATEEAIDFLAIRFDEPEHDTVHDRRVGRGVRPLDLAVDCDDVVQDLLDVIARVVRTRTLSPGW
jgi:hypothetical protein